MDIRFDGCIEELLEYLGAEKPELKPATDALAATLPDFRKDCLKERICPEGELARGWMARNILRDAVKRMEARLTDPPLSSRHRKYPKQLYCTLPRWAGCFCEPEAERSVAEFSLRFVAGHATYLFLYS